MSEQHPEDAQPREPETREFSHAEESKSITGSGQTIGLTPGENFIMPTMALDSLETEQEQSDE